MDCFQVAGISIGVEWESIPGKRRCYGYHDCIILPRMLEAFRCRIPPEDPDMRVRVCSLQDCAVPPDCKRISSQAFYRAGGLMMMTVHDPCDPAVPGYTLAMNADYSRTEYMPHIAGFEHYDLQWLMYPFENRVLYRGGAVMHGAAVEHGGKGFIFTGISGAGKSTQVHLWQTYRNAVILNGDCPAVFVPDGKPRVFGTPWCGSSGESINRSAPLAAVILARQGKQNQLKELTGDNAFLGLLANVFRSNFDGAALDLAIANLQTIVRDVRVFEFTCTVEEAAVDMLEKELFQEARG